MTALGWTQEGWTQEKLEMVYILSVGKTLYVILKLIEIYKLKTDAFYDVNDLFVNLILKYKIIKLKKKNH